MQLCTCVFTVFFSAQNTLWQFIFKFTFHKHLCQWNMWACALNVNTKTGVKCVFWGFFLDSLFRYVTHKSLKLWGTIPQSNENPWGKKPKKRQATKCPINILISKSWVEKTGFVSPCFFLSLWSFLDMQTSLHLISLCCFRLAPCRCGNYNFSHHQQLLLLPMPNNGAALLVLTVLATSFYLYALY